jgi:FemAB-related protein (PEP-CTERM system-associated)
MTIAVPGIDAQGEPRAARRAACQVESLPPAIEDQWDRYVLAHPEGTLFHTLAWRDAVAGVFHHESVYLTAMRGDRLVGVLPMSLVASRFAGRMLASVPYGVGGGIIADDEAAVAALFQAAKRIATDRGCGMIDFRSERAVVPGLPAVDRYVGFRRDLPNRVDDMLGFLPRKARAAARNARNKYKLTVSVDDDHLPEVWRLYAISMRRLASLNYPYSFFERLVTQTPGKHWVSLVRWKGRPVAGLVTFLFKDRVLPYFIGTTDDAKRCSAANYIYLTVMERAVQEGYRVFDFGRTRRDNGGSFAFKRFQGFEPRPLGYQVYTAPGADTPNLSPDNPKFNLTRRVWSHLPLCVTRPLGAALARHIPG